MADQGMIGLERGSIRALEAALDRLARGFGNVPPFLPGAAFDEEAEAVLMEVAEALHADYPYFHALCAGQMLKPPHPLARAAYSLAMWMNPNNHALDAAKASSAMEKEAAEKDSEDALLWKFNHRRLEAEEIRDAMLAVSARLNLKAGGPSYMVPIDPELVLMLKRPQYWVPTRDKSEYGRRTVYMIYKRNLRLPFEEVFDAPDTLLSCARREQSTHAPQALELLNGQTSNELAAAFAQRLLKERATPAGRVDYAWRLAAGRAPTPAEKSLALQFFADAPDDPARVKEFALAMFNLNAFLYVN